MKKVLCCACMHTEMKGDKSIESEWIAADELPDTPCEKCGIVRAFNSRVNIPGEPLIDALMEANGL